MRPVATLVTALGLLWAGPAAADRALPFTPAIDRLDNGLTVVTVKTSTPGIVAYYTVVRTGSRDEVEQGRSGYAHFFEHMMFRGTEATSPEQYNAVVQALGADGNAYTTDDYTAYYLVTPKRGLEAVIGLEADRFQHLKYAEEAFRTEAGAVLGEYNNSASDPREKMWEAGAALAFKAHTYGHTVIGYKADIEAMPDGFAYARDFFRRHYTPDNSTVLVIGDVDHAEVMRLVRAAYGAWTGKADAVEVPVEPPQTARRAQHIDWPSPSPPLVSVGWRVPGLSAATVDSAAIDVLLELAVGETSPLYKRLVLDEQRVEKLTHGADWKRRDPWILSVDAVLRDATERDAIVAAIQGELDRAARGEIDADRLAAIRSNLRYARLMALDTPGDVGGYLAEIIGLSGDVEDAERMLEGYAQVTAADVARVAKAHFAAPQQIEISLTGTSAEGAK